MWMANLYSFFFKKWIATWHEPPTMINDTIITWISTILLENCSAWGQSNFGLKKLNVSVVDITVVLRTIRRPEITIADELPKNFLFIFIEEWTGWHCLNSPQTHYHFQSNNKEFNLISLNAHRLTSFIAHSKDVFHQILKHLEVG